jgi:hypothetical protein
MGGETYREAREGPPGLHLDNRTAFTMDGLGQHGFMGHFFVGWNKGA